jgi:5-bromo-4-chloroindolyl phosphate hydrolysis protein
MSAAVAAVNKQLNPVSQPQKSEAKVSNNTGISFTNVFEIVRRSLDGVMVVAENNRAGEADLNKSKLEIEKKRQFKTDLEEAHEILNKIAKVMEKHGKRG